MHSISKIFYILIILAVIFSVSAASAMENGSSFGQDFSKSNYEMLNEIPLSEETLNENSADFSISDLADKINSAHDDEVTIEGNYIYDDELDQEYEDGLQINRDNSLAIYGNDNLTIEGNLIFNVSNLTFSKATFSNCILTNLEGSVLEFKNCKFDNTQFLNYQDMTFTQCNMEHSNITNYGSFASEGWSMNPNRYPISSSNFTNYGNIAFLNQLITENSFFNWENITTSRSYLEYNLIENNGGEINLTTWVERNNITNNAGEINLIKVNFVFNRLMNYDVVNFINDGNFLSEEYIEGNTLVNLKGIMTFASGFFSANNITNRDMITFAKVDSTSDNITNYGDLKYLAAENDYYEGFTNYLSKESIINYGNLTIESGKISELSLNSTEGATNLSDSYIELSNMTNYGTLCLNEVNMTSCGIDNHNIIEYSGVNMDNMAINPNAIVYCSDVTMNYGEKRTLKIYISDLTGNPLGYVPFVVDLNGKTYNLTTDASGNAGLEIPALNSGIYDVSIFNDDLNHKINSSSLIITVSNLYVIESIDSFSNKHLSKTICPGSNDVFINLNKLNGAYDSVKYIKIYSKDPSTSFKLSIKLNGKSYEYSQITSKSFKIPKLTVGNYKITIKITSGNHNAFINQSITVTKAKTTVSLAKSVKKNKKLKITVKSKTTKKVVKSIKIKVKVYTGKKAKTYELKTNKKGIAQLKTKKLKKGKHKLVITSLNKNYKISKKITIKVK